MREKEGLEALVHARVRALSPYAPAPHAAKVRLDANESPYPLSESARARLATLLASVELHRYPDLRAQPLRESLARSLSARPEELVLGSGSDEVIALLLSTFGEARAPGEKAKVLVPSPTFVMYGISASVAGLEVVEVPLDARFDLDVAAMGAALQAHRPHLCFLASPNNPTGRAYAPELIADLARQAPGTLFVLDEAYGAFTEKRLSPLFGLLPNVALLGTLSKIGFAAARFGWARLPASLAAEVDKVRQPYNLNTLTQVAARFALDSLDDELAEHVRALREARAPLFEALSRFDFLRPYPSDANFFLVRVTRGAGLALDAHLRREGIAVRAYAPTHALADHLRITIGTAEENTLLLAALSSYQISRPGAR